MPKFFLNDISNATQGSPLSQSCLEFSGFTADSRDSEIKGKIFFPLVGDNHNGHDYVQSAVENGASGVLVHEWRDEWEPLKKEASFIEVQDTLKALQDFSQFWRKKFDAVVIGLTGSNGKTTTKDFLSQILSHKDKTVASQGSFNNHWGVPFTLLKINEDTKFCVVEMGMNHPGELTTLNGIAQPDIVVVTNVGRAHMGHFSDVDGIAKAKEEIYISAPKKSKFVFNLDNTWTQKMFRDHQGRELYAYSTKDFSADVYLKLKKSLPQGFEIEGQINGVLGKAKVQFWGEHNIENLSAAACLASVAGMNPNEIWSVLDQCHTGWGRNQWVETKGCGQILFDGYNANPDSFSTLLENLGRVFDSKKKKVAIFGEMLELGEKSAAEHKSLGEQSGRLAWDEVIFVGPSGASFLEGWKLSKNKKTPIILNTYKESLDIDILSMVNEETLTVIKGSRGGALERIIQRMNPISFPQK
jgi:UDP-N-acetylmuramoyl-tripeptide--D-alanyl-D-alanine ligase